MYPYNHRTQTPPSSILAKENIQAPSGHPPLSADRRLQELLQLAGKDAAVLEQKYTALLQENRLQDAAEILKTMETDSKKHRRILREILFTLFSDTLEDIVEEIMEDEPETADAEDLLEELLLTELDDITFYRSLLSSMEDDDLWELIFEIIVDKQNHAAALNHLYAKYMR